MGPQPQPAQELDEAAKSRNEADERECMNRINYQLERFGCVMRAEAVLSDGMVQTRIAVIKVPPEVLKTQKKAQQNGGAIPAPGSAEPNAS